MRGRSMPRAAAAAAAAAGGGGGPCAGGLVQPPGGPQRMGGGQLSLQHAIPVDVCTLHVSNLPVDFDERELFCLFGTMPGYMNATMMFDPVRPPVAFVTFNSAQAAAEATRIAGAMPWEPGCDQMFKIGLARSQQRVLAGDKRIHTVGVKPPQMRRRVSQMSAPHQHAAAADPWRGGPAAGGRGVGQAVALPAAGPVAGGGPFQQGYPVQPPGPQQCQHQQHQQQQQQQQQQPPMYGGQQWAPAVPQSSTLYVTLPRGCGVTIDNDQALAEVYQHFPGFVGIKVQGGRAWVRFQTPDAAAAAMQSTDGRPTPHTQGNGLQVQMARSDSR